MIRLERSLATILQDYPPTTTVAQMLASATTPRFRQWLEQEQERLRQMSTYEGFTFEQEPKDYVAGGDEVGRGPAAGPLVAGAAAFRSLPWIPGLKDSKQLTHAERLAMVPWIRAQAVAVSLVEVSVESLNTSGTILSHSLEAIAQAALALHLPLRQLLVDGNADIPNFPYPQQAIIKGDNYSLSIAAASVVAKVHRDLIMLELDKLYPQYGFAQHKGYCTELHRQALQEYGPCPEHRIKYVTVQRVLKSQAQQLSLEL